jgi:Trypsin-co-occurring domain 1
VAGLARIALEDGGSILVETAAGFRGPVKAGRLGEAVQEMPASLQGVFEPVADMARTVLHQLRRAGPAEVEVEFGVDLAVQAGVVITRTGAGCHLTVKLVWKHDQGDRA